MQIEAEKFLPIAEKAGAIAFVDIESANLKADFGTAVVVSVRPIGGPPTTFVARPGRDKALLKAVSIEVAKYPVWVTFYGRRFDIPFLNSRLLRHGLPPLPKYHHIDLWQVIKGATAISRRNQAHLLEWLEAPVHKMSVSPNVWAEAIHADPVNGLQTLKERCESDVEGLEGLYHKVKHLIGEITR